VVGEGVDRISGLNLNLLEIDLFITRHFLRAGRGGGII
jgi:hypothetical protein